MSEIEKTVFPIAAIGGILVNAPRTGALMFAAILLTLLAAADARGAFADLSRRVRGSKPLRSGAQTIGQAYRRSRSSQAQA